jgi:hypothetical protein
LVKLYFQPKIIKLQQPQVESYELPYKQEAPIESPIKPPKLQPKPQFQFKPPQYSADYKSSFNRDYEIERYNNSRTNMYDIPYNMSTTSTYDPNQDTHLHDIITDYYKTNVLEKLNNKRLSNILTHAFVNNILEKTIEKMK